jgi:hypothetical protein
MKKLTTIVLIGFLTIPFPGSASEERAAWFAERWKIIEEAHVRPDEKAIKNLGAIARGLGRKKEELTPETKELYDAAVRTLLAIPGHAEWSGKEIKAMTDDAVNRTGLQFEGRREWHFETLSQLQSPETVKVLGEQLFDDRSPFKGPPNDAEWIPSSNFAVSALHKLGLDNAPVKSIYADPRNDLRTWQLWFEQVRAGTRTFSFKGDKTIYSLTGPVSTALDPSEVRPAAPQPAPGSASVSPGSSNPSVWIALSLAVVALIFAAKLAFTRKPA